MWEHEEIQISLPELLGSQIYREASFQFLHNPKALKAIIIIEASVYPPSDGQAIFLVILPINGVQLCAGAYLAPSDECAAFLQVVLN